MADVSNVVVNGTTYTLNDTSAEQSLTKISPLSGMAYGSVPANSTATITADTALIFTWRGHDGGVFGVAGSATVTNIVESTKVTVTTTGSVITINNTATAAIRYAALIFS